MSLTARRLNRATLGRWLLLRRESLDVVEAVRRVVALQAQSAASPYLALWNRLAGVVGYVAGVWRPVDSASKPRRSTSCPTGPGPA
jgi:hypothetical protein